MDLNELLHAHQIEVMKASVTGDETSRQSHFDKVALYAERIGQLRDMLPGSRPLSQAASPETVIYGTYAGSAPAKPGSRTMDSWENEGGSLDPPETPLPDGMTSNLVRQYMVGRFVYTDFKLALAEQARQASSPTGLSAEG